MPVSAPGMAKGRYVLAGGAGHGLVVARAAASAGLALIGYLDIQESAFDLGLPWLGNDEQLAKLVEDGCDGFLFGIGSVDKKTALRRAQIFDKLSEIAVPGPAIIHARSNVSDAACLGPATLAARGCIVGEDVVIGTNVILNTGCSVDHHCEIGDHCHIAPGVTLSGGVKIGKRVLVGAGATVIQNIVIGDNAVIAAGAVVVNDIPDNAFATGIPAKNMF
jgi:sugar O-acyltransferase (sialic acid O-acetyltransferase NeuD family)